jgi:hypothetical protein
MQQDVEMFTDEVPLACTLTRSELVTRKQEVNGLFKYVQQVNELADGYALRFPGSDTWANDLMQFITFERACCPFFTFALVFEQKLGTNPSHQRRCASTAAQSGGTSGEGSIWLHLRGPEGVKAIVEGMIDKQTR